MRVKELGDGTSVSVLGIGCGRVGSISNPVPRQEVEATLEAAIDAGITLFDTADIYGQGDSERTLGRLLRRYPDRMLVVTKVGGRHARFARLVRLAKPALRTLARHRPSVQRAAVATRSATVVHDFARADLDPAIERSRRRLKLDCLHGVLLHNPSTETLGQPQIHDFLAELLRTSRATRVGVSVDTVPAVEAAMALPMITMIQAPGYVAEVLTGSEVADQLRERGIALFVREILKERSCRTLKLSASEAIADATRPDFVTAAIVGVSTRQHLSDLLPALR